MRHASPPAGNVIVKLSPSSNGPRSSQLLIIFFSQVYCMPLAPKSRRHKLEPPTNVSLVCFTSLAPASRLSLSRRSQISTSSSRRNSNASSVIARALARTSFTTSLLLHTSTDDKGASAGPSSSIRRSGGKTSLESHLQHGAEKPEETMCRSISGGSKREEMLSHTVCVCVCFA